MARKERTRPGVWGGLTDPHVKGGVIMDRRGGCERSGVALQNWTTRRLP